MEEVAIQHQKYLFLTHADVQQLCFYTVGAQLNNKCRAGIYASRVGETVHESPYYLGEECEVFDAYLVIFYLLIIHIAYNPQVMAN
jgi:hypothetical protein